MDSQRTAAAGDDAAGAALAALAVALDDLCTAAWWQIASSDLAGIIGLLHRAESRVAAAQVAVLGEAVARGVPAADGAKSPASWLRGLVPVTPQHASARAALAEALHGPHSSLAPTRAAFGAGDISVAHAGVVARTVTALDALPIVPDETTRGEVQELLLQTATRVDPAQLSRAGLRVRLRLDPDAPARLARDEDAQQEAREAYLVQDSTGMWRLQAHLTPLSGAALSAAVESLAAPRPAEDGTPDPRTARQRMADGLTALAELSLAARAGSPDGLPTRAGAPTRLVLTGDLSTLLADVTTRGALAGIAPGTLETGQPDGWPVSALTMQMLACDAEVLPVLLDGDSGRPLDVGDTRYPFPPRIRRAIEVRDRHCTYPRCTAKPPWCHTHHLIPFGRSRKTSEDNGTLLCGHHHRLIHARGWQGEIRDGQVEWRPPDGDEPQRNAFSQDFERALRRLARRWLARQRPPDTG
jgi:hypothetical protein